MQGMINEAKEVLIKAWNDYRMSNIIVFCENEKFIITVVFYNPFDKNFNEEGRFWSFKVTSTNNVEIFDTIDELFNKRYGKKLSNFAMTKVIMNDGFFNENLVTERKSIEIIEHLLKTKMKTIEVKHFGSKLSNGTLVGVFKLIEDELVDISFTSQLVHNFGLNNTIFLQPTDSVYRLFVIKKNPTKTPKIFAHVSGAFDRNFIYFYIFVLCILVVSIKMQNSETELTLIILYCVGVSSAVSVPMIRYTKNHQRITFCSLLIFSMIICGAFQGCIVVKLRKNEKFKEMGTLQELVESNLNLMTISSVERPFKPSNGSYINKLYEQLDKRTSSVLPLQNIKIMTQTYINKPNAALLSKYFTYDSE